MAPSRLADIVPPEDDGLSLSDGEETSRSSESEPDTDDIVPRPSKRRKLSSSPEPDIAPLDALPSLSRIRRSKTLPAFPEPKIPPSSTQIQTSNSTFSSLDVVPWLTAALASMEVHHPTPIQQSCIPAILGGRDCIGGSRTGSGKTIAFAVPMLQRWAEDPFGIYGVVLTPTRELALQIHEQFLALGAPQSLKSVLITGGTEMRPQALALSTRPHIVIATPGRLADHIRTSGPDTTRGLSRVRVIVLDEADRLLASGPGSMLPDVSTCLSALPASTARQTLLFTATVTSEVRALKALPRPPSRPPIHISEISTETTTAIPPTLHQTYLKVPLSHRDSFLHVLLLTPLNISKSTIVFVNRTRTADLLERILRKLDHHVTSLHSALNQSQRTSNLAKFRASASRILVATDVASRGLDIPAVGLVVNFDVPRNPDDYVHRVGRTARAGRKGESVTFVGQRDAELVLGIEERVGRVMEEWREEVRGVGKTDEWVNLESRVVKGNLLKEVGEARMEALREVEEGRDVRARKRAGVKKEKK